MLLWTNEQLLDNRFDLISNSLTMKTTITEYKYHMELFIKKRIFFYISTFFEEKSLRNIIEFKMQIVDLKKLVRVDSVLTMEV